MARSAKLERWLPGGWSGNVVQAKEVEERLREFVIGSYVGER